MEGPSIVILVEEASKFVGKRVRLSGGSSKVIDVKSLRGQKLLQLSSWGKHFLMVFDKTVLKVHFMLYGSYRIDEERQGMKPRLRLRFPNGEFLAFACSIRELKEPITSLYDWKIDLMSEQWDERVVLRRLERHRDMLACDALLDQSIFAGSGNIIKNEVLFRMKLQPETRLSALSKEELRLLARETRLYSYQFYVWKRQFVLRKNYRIYRQSKCPDCGGKIKLKATGKFERRSFFCPVCQRLRKRSLTGRIQIARISKRATELSERIADIRAEISAAKVRGEAEREH